MEDSLALGLGVSSVEDSVVLGFSLEVMVEVAVVGAAVVVAGLLEEASARTWSQKVLVAGRTLPGGLLV